MLRIVIREKNGQQRELQLDKPEMVIGRVPSADIPLPKNNVSKRHAKVVNNHGTWELVDMKSTNGTYVNGQRVDTHRLTPSDQVIIGDFLLQFEVMDLNASAPPPLPNAGGMGAPPTMPPGPTMPPTPPSMPPTPPSMPPSAPPPGFSPPGAGAPPPPPPAAVFGRPAAPPAAPSIAGPPSFPQGTAEMGSFGTPPPAAPAGPPPIPMGGPSAPPPIPGMNKNRPPAPPPVGGFGGDGRQPMTPPPPPSVGGADFGAPSGSADNLSAAQNQALEEMDSIEDLHVDSLDDFGDLGMVDSLDGPSTNDDLPAVQDDAASSEALDASEAKPTSVLTPPPPSSEQQDADNAVEEAPTPIPVSGPPTTPPPSFSTPAPATPAPTKKPKKPRVLAKLDKKKTPPPATPTPTPLPASTPTPAPQPPAPTISKPLDAPEQLKRALTGSKGPFDNANMTPPPASAPSVSKLSADQQPFAAAVGLVLEQLREKHPHLIRVPLPTEPPARVEIQQATKNIVRALRNDKAFERSLPANDITKQAVQEAVGWGPIETLLEQSDVSAIFVNSADSIFVEKGATSEPTDLFFSSEASLERIIQRMISPQGIRVDRSSGAIEARLPDGTWLHAMMPPISTHGISLVIQPPRPQQVNLAQLLDTDLFDDKMREFLELCIQQRRNILLAGDPGSGRTTLLGALASMIPQNERVVSVERVRELELAHPHWVALETRAPDAHGNGGISLQSLIEHSLRIRPQRILLGDIEGSEVQSILPRMLLGLDGVMMTARATSPEQLLYRLETLLLTSTSISSRHAASHQIGAAFDVVIQLNQFACGSRKVTSICELASDEEGTLFLNELFSFQKEGNDADGRIKGTFVPTGAQPQFYQELDRLGVQLNTDLFATT